MTTPTTTPATEVAATSVAPATTPATPAATPDTPITSNSPDSGAVDPAVAALAAEQAAKGDPKPDAKPDAKSAGAPEKYEFKLAEGVTLPADFEKFAREKNLTQDQADLVLSRETAAVAAHAKASADNFKAAVTQWAVDAKADKALNEGGFEANLAKAKEARDAFGSPEMKTFLDATGYGNHPVVIKHFLSLNKLIAQDGVIIGAAKRASDDEAQLNRMYPTHTKK